MIRTLPDSVLWQKEKDKWKDACSNLTTDNNLVSVI
jgi:hypothetical protein